MKVEIWSDIVCPWCYIGKRRFEAALEQFAHTDEVAVTWRSFELSPDSPRRVEGTLAAMLARKMGRSLEQAEAMNARITGVAAEVGLDYQLDRAQPGNTFDAHRLVHLAAARDLQGVVQERLFRAYFTEGRAIGDPDTLVEVVAEAGIDANEVRDVLEGDRYADAVRADEQRAATFGITGVPFVVIDEAFGVSGAQPSEVFLGALQQAWTAAHPLAIVGGSDDAASCEGDSCELPSGRG